MLRFRQWLKAPDTEEATTCAAPVPTAIEGGMPSRISSGVMMKPPPIPNMPDRMPTARPIDSSSSTFIDS